MTDAETMDSTVFKTVHAKEWLLRRQAIETIMVDNFGKKARKWNRNRKDKNVWLWGGTGLGKSRWANKQAPPWAVLKKNQQMVAHT
jgi:putative ribosome biogenesis GTPase RsgA